MSAGAEPYSAALSAAVRHAGDWLASLPGRRVGPGLAAHDLAADFGGPLPEQGMPAVDVVDYLAL
jgi:hypothetical protein